MRERQVMRHHRRAWRWVSAAFGALITLPAFADAPKDQYELFDREARTIKDTFTRLEWERRLSSIPLGHSISESRCNAFFAGGRLPTVKELLTILDEEPHQEYESGAVVPKRLDALAFPDAPIGKPYWTSTPADATSMWAVNFSTGEMVKVATSDSALSRCVR